MFRFLFSFFRSDSDTIADTCIKKTLDGIILFLLTMMPERSARKVVAVILLLVRWPVKTVGKYSGFRKSSIYELRKKVRQLEPDTNFLRFVRELCIVKKGRGRKSPIKDIETEIITHVESVNCFTIAEIRQWILDTYGITVSKRHLSKFLRQNGIRKLKGGSIPAKADVDKQKTFYDDVLHPLMQKAGKGKQVLLFADASHFVLGCDFIGSVYGKKRRFARTYSGRKRYNVLGALDFHTKKVLTVTNDTYIKADSVCDLLQKIRATYKGKIIHLILDNAKYQKCECVQELADKLHINLIYLPPYSPNLNLIERLWRFTKFELRKAAWADFDTFRSKIDEIIASASKENKNRLDMLIGEKVQLYDAYKLLENGTLSPPEVDKAAV